ncbi:hypothetical protein [Methyloversatilis sp. XJ19-49]|uniref:hypothetical protein n=1 Tax=Methyloversatilis sp. XJ19-49 TaxID=2963429 RepID=UPI00211BA737|nr:hypothetical protein [Methyloversatilis sp. XJ19-49]MCQ9377660.1 hypothetical protein [Methyloversatilis sp. XJ19-49]
MRRHFLAPIKNPTWRDYFLRVGSALGVVVIAILGARTFFPGYEGVAVLLVAGLGISVAVIQGARHPVDKHGAKLHEGRK